MNQWLSEIWLRQRKAVLLVTHSVEEAIYLADEVVVMSARPGRVLQRIEIPLEYPRQTEDLSRPDIVEISAEIHRLLGVQG
jgi:ABC-type nitrate/sulfonate/bicarbonate transport system ATPase subunit